MGRLVTDEWLWRWCENCDEDYKVPVGGHKCPRCSRKFAERAQDPPAWSKEWDNPSQA